LQRYTRRLNGFQKSRHLGDSLAVVGLIVVWLVFNFRNFSSKINSAIFPDNESMTNPLLSGMSRALKDNAWPLWNSTLWGGVPLYNQPQVTPFYPFYFLRFANYDGTLNTMRTVHLLVLLHLLFFLLTSYLLLRVIKISSIFSFVGSLIIVFNANTLGVLSWLSAIATIAWIPSLIAGLIILYRDRRRSGAIIFFSSVLFIASAAPSHRLIFSLYLTLVITLFFFFQTESGRRAQWLKEVLSGSFQIAIAFIALIVPIFLPFFLSTDGLIRWVGSAAPGYVIGDEKIPFPNFTEYQLNVNEFQDLLLQPESPNAIGNVHLGLLISLLFAISIYFGFKSKYFKLFFFIAIYSLLSAFGSNLGLAYLNYNLPFLDKIREPLQFLTLWNIAVGVCIAIGLQTLFSPQRIQHPKDSKLKTKWIVTEKTPNSKVGISLLFAITFTFIHFMNTPWTMTPFESSTYIGEGQKELNVVFDEISRLDPQREYRVITDNSFNSQIAGGLASFKGLRTLQSLLNPAPVDNFQDMYFYDGRGSNYINLLGIKYSICKGCGKEFGVGLAQYENFRFLKSIQSYSIFENPQAFPYVSMLTSYQGVSNDMGELVAQLPKMKNGLPFALIPKEQTLKLQVKNDPEVQMCEISMTRSDSNSRDFISDCESNSLFILNEYFNEDWKIELNGKQIDSFRINQVQIGSFIPSGKSMISVQFYPDKVRYSFVFTLTVFALMTILKISRLRQSRVFRRHRK
jgi:hypothetical protein